MKMLMVQIFRWILFSQFVGKFAKTFAPMFGVVFFVITWICFIGNRICGLFFFPSGFFVWQ